MDVSVTMHCPRCSATLARGAVACARCGRAPLSYREADAPAAADAVRAWIGGRAYRVLGRVARGDACEVLLAERDARLTERVVLKVPRAARDLPRLAREWAALCDLQAREHVQGAHHFTTLLPQPVAHDGEASVFRWRSGFVHTLDEVVAEYPDGVEPQTVVWMWKRALGLLGWVHRAGYVHGAVLPRHLLVHPRDHGVALVGWSRAVRLAAGATEPLGAVPDAARVYYPRAALDGAAPTPATDIAMSARCMVYALGGDPASGALAADVPRPLAELLRAHATDGDDDDAAGCARSGDAWELMERVGRAGREAFGPPRYHPFRMPGWR